MAANNYGSAAVGQVKVAVDATDDYAGLDSLTFPDVFTQDGATRPLNGVLASHEEHAYTVVASQTLAADFNITAVDLFGNQGSSEPFRVEKDVAPGCARTGGPALTGLNLSVTPAGDPQYLYTREMPPAFYYHPTASGTLTLTVTAADSQSGLAQVTFPHIFTASDGLPLPQTGQAGPETLTHTYNLVGSAALSQSLTVTATDKVDNLAAGQSFPVVQDTMAPTVVITIPDRVPLVFDISWGGRDLANAAGAPGAGIRHYDVQYRTALTTTWSDLLTQTISTTTRFMGQIGQEYYFLIRATDRFASAIPAPGSKPGRLSWHSQG